METWQEEALEVLIDITTTSQDMLKVGAWGPTPEAHNENLFRAAKNHIDSIAERININHTLDIPNERALFRQVGSSAVNYIKYYNNCKAEEVPEFVAAIVSRKQYDYGTKNILKFGTVGVWVRLSDKFERLDNLLKSASPPANETLLDTYVDILGYATVGIMVLDKTFELPLTDRWINKTVGHKPPPTELAPQPGTITSASIHGRVEPKVVPQTLPFESPSGAGAITSESLRNPIREG